MKIEVEYVNEPEVKVSVYKLAGAKGGKARVAKGFAKMDKERAREISRKAAAKRWGGRGEN